MQTRRNDCHWRTHIRTLLARPSTPPLLQEVALAFQGAAGGQLHVHGVHRRLHVQHVPHGRLLGRLHQYVTAVLQCRVPDKQEKERARVSHHMLLQRDATPSVLLATASSGVWYCHIQLLGGPLRAAVCYRMSSRRTVQRMKSQCATSPWRSPTLRRSSRRCERRTFAPHCGGGIVPVVRTARLR